MSYDCIYSLEILNQQTLTPADENLARTIISDLYLYSEMARIALDEMGDAEEPCSWRESGVELKRLSQRFDTFIFRMTIIGAETDFFSEQLIFRNGTVAIFSGRIEYPGADDYIFSMKP